MSESRGKPSRSDSRDRYRQERSDNRGYRNDTRDNRNDTRDNRNDNRGDSRRARSRSRSRSRDRRRDDRENDREVRKERGHESARAHPVSSNPLGPAKSDQQWGVQAAPEDATEEEPEVPQYKPDFGLSGALAKDERTGNMVNGVVLKFTEPFEASMPDKKWRLYVYKGDELVDTLHIHRRSCFLLGRDDRVVDVSIQHPSSSLQHAVIQFRAMDVKQVVDGERTIVQVIKPYLLDLKSTHGSFLNGQRIDDSRYYELREGDVLKFGGSTREYVLLHDQSGKE